MLFSAWSGSCHHQQNDQLFAGGAARQNRFDTIRSAQHEELRREGIKSTTLANRFE